MGKASGCVQQLGRAVCWVPLLSGIVSGAPWLSGTIGWALKCLLRVTVQVPGYVGLEAMLTS